MMISAIIKHHKVQVFVLAIKLLTFPSKIMMFDCVLSIPYYILCTIFFYKSFYL